METKPVYQKKLHNTKQRAIKKLYDADGIRKEKINGNIKRDKMVFDKLTKDG